MNEYNIGKIDHSFHEGVTYGRSEIKCINCKHSNQTYCMKAKKWAYLMTKGECDDAKDS